MNVEIMWIDARHMIFISISYDFHMCFYVFKPRTRFGRRHFGPRAWSRAQQSEKNNKNTYIKIIDMN